MERPWRQFYDEQVPGSIEYPDMTLYQLFQMAVEENPNGIATVFFGGKLKYRQVDALVSRFANGLAEMGVEKGDRVALMLPNIPGYPIAHFAVARLGGVLVPTNPLYVERELEHQLNDAGAETVVVLDQLLPKLEKVRSVTSVKRIIVMSVKDFLPWPISFVYGLKNKSRVTSDPTIGLLTYADFMKKSYQEAVERYVSPDDRAMLLYTGGTTGVSKGAVLSHRNVVTNVYQTRHWLWSLDEQKETILCVLPFFHSYGMTTALHLAILLQSRMLLLPRFELADVAKAIKKYRPTVFCAVPAMYNAVNRYPKLAPEDVSSIKLCVSGGAALPLEVQKRFEERSGGRLVEGYGLTETSPVASVNPVHGYRKSGTIGVPVSDTDIQIVDIDSKEPVPLGEVGEVAISGPQVMEGYWNRPDETKEVLKDGWLFTGDMGSMDNKGFVKIVDRKKDVIISAGMNIFPREVEEVLHQHPKVVEAAVIGVPSKVREEIVRAYIVLEPGASLTKADIAEFCRDKLSKFKIPKQVEFVSELPKSAMGKTLKRVLKENLNK